MIKSLLIVLAVVIGSPAFGKACVDFPAAVGAKPEGADDFHVQSLTPFKHKSDSWGAPADPVEDNGSYESTYTGTFTKPPAKLCFEDITISSGTAAATKNIIDKAWWTQGGVLHSYATFTSILKDGREKIIPIADLEAGKYHVSQVPEPGNWIMLLSGFAIVGVSLRRSKPYTKQTM